MGKNSLKKTAGDVLLHKKKLTTGKSILNIAKSSKVIKKTSNNNSEKKLLRSVKFGELSTKKAHKSVVRQSSSSNKFKDSPPKTVAQNTGPPEFDEEIVTISKNYKVKTKDVQKALQELISFTSANVKSKNELFSEDFPLFLQINCIKVHKMHSKILRIPLKHTILKADSEICLIVPDVKGIKNKNHEEHLEHYENLLRKKEVRNIKKIMTFHEFRTEYEAFEMKRRLVELYDTFLVDGKISGKVVHKCGKIFYNKRKVPTCIKLQATKLKQHIEKTLKKSSLYLHAKGNTFIMQIGHNGMSISDLVDNVFYAIQGLDKDFPGGFENIRNLSISASNGVTIPIYITLKNQNSVPKMDLTKKIKKRPDVQGELTTKLNTGVIVKASGDVKTYKLQK